MIKCDICHDKAVKVVKCNTCHYNMNLCNRCFRFLMVRRKVKMIRYIEEIDHENDKMTEGYKDE